MFFEPKMDKTNIRCKNWDKVCLSLVGKGIGTENYAKFDTVVFSSMREFPYACIYVK